MTIHNTINVPHLFTRADAACAAAEKVIAERTLIGAMLKAECAAYSALLNEEGGFGDTLHAWLANEVLPSLRKTGGYLVDEDFRHTARSIVSGNTGIMMLPLLADISERGVDAVR